MLFTLKGVIMSGGFGGSKPKAGKSGKKGSGPDDEEMSFIYWFELHNYVVD